MNDSKASESVPDTPSNTVYLLFYEKVKKWRYKNNKEEDKFQRLINFFQ